MLDPLTALGLASSIIQVVDFGRKLVSQTQETYYTANGATKENVTVGEIAKDINVLNRSLKEKKISLEAPHADDVALEDLVTSSQKIAEDLLGLLATLEVPKDATTWKRFQKAFKSTQKAREVREIESRLNKIQRQIDSRLHYMISDQQSAMLVRLNEISKEHANIWTESSSQMEQLKKEIRDNSKRQENDSKRARVLMEKLQCLAEEGARMANEERILQSLMFDEWQRRFTIVGKAHKQTFDWMLAGSETSETQPKISRASISTPNVVSQSAEEVQSGDPNSVALPPTGFKEWLQVQDGIFWIAGKAGSGKSTLMKFLKDHREVKEYLEDWAGPRVKVSILHWFFWNAGSPMQKSREGLFQSLLFQILRECPWLIPIVCAERWEDNSYYGEKNNPWTLDELSDAFDILARQPIMTNKFCMFIDGLDEYDGPPSEIIRVLKRIAKSQSIKLCLSSRRWNDFQKAFGNGKSDNSILLEDYTKRDIERFVRDILEQDESFTEAEREDKRYNLFVDDVIRRAKGVFLWVQLVVTSLLKGLGEGNRLEDLQSKLETMPRTLKKYFQQIFDRIDESYWTESAKVFLITAHAVQPLSITAYHYLETEEKRPGYALSAPIRPMSNKQLSDVFEELISRLNFLCRDLLEVNQVIMDSKFRDYKVDFLHRTVKDFLMDKQMLQQLMQRATKDHTQEWNPHRSLCNVALARAKSLPLRDGIQDGINMLFSLVDEFMFYAHMAEHEGGVSEIRVLDELDRVISKFARVDMICHWTNGRDPPTGMYFEENGNNTFLALAIQSRLRLYAKTKLEQRHNPLRAKRGRPYLDYALRPNLVTPTKLPHYVEYIDFKMVEMLLEKGADPNEKVSIYGGITVWALFLLSCYERRDSCEPSTKETWFKAARMMITKGARRELKLETVRKETFTIGSALEKTYAKTAKYGRAVTKGGTRTIELDVPEELTAMNILEKVFGDSMMDELNAIAAETQTWSVWNMIGWS
ncbi:hypothetical protein P7C71_g658, partial [Lecanoromycetidae sp. Uapishka_2]